MTKYGQKPAGWWQDNKGRMQPPGSFQDPSLRVPPELPPETADRRSSTRFVRRLLGAVHREPENHSSGHLRRGEHLRASAGSDQQPD